MIFLYIYIGFSLLTFVTVLMQSYVIVKRLKRNHPEIISEVKKNGILEKIFGWIKILIICFIPVINVATFYASLFKEEEVEEKVLKKSRKD